MAYLQILTPPRPLQKTPATSFVKLCFCHLYTLGDISSIMVYYYYSIIYYYFFKF